MFDLNLNVANLPVVEEVVICGFPPVQETVDVVTLYVTTQVFPLPKMSEIKKKVKSIVISV